jgi:hypothetical protein
MKRRRFKRRGPGERFLLIPFDLLLSLPEQHVTVLVDLCKRHNGKNNGAIGYGWRDANRAARVSRGGRILDDLRERGIIKLTADASFNMKTGRRTREWEISFLVDSPAFKGKRKLCLDHWLLNSTAYSRLTAGEKKLLFELMRRYDGGNNGEIVFGIQSGASVGSGRTRTSRALSKLERLGFIVMTATAEPQHETPRRWRLTMYPAGGRPPTKDFMRANPGPEILVRGCSGATEPPVSATLVQRTSAPAGGISGQLPHPSRRDNKVMSGLTETSFGSSRAAQHTSNSFTEAAHIEASQRLPRGQRASARFKAPPVGPTHPSDPKTAAAPSLSPQRLPSSITGDRAPGETTDKPSSPRPNTPRASGRIDTRQGDLFAEHPPDPG